MENGKVGIPSNILKMCPMPVMQQMRASQAEGGFIDDEAQILYLISVLEGGHLNLLEQQQLKRQLELDKIRAEENKKREQQQLEVERLKKGFGKPHSTYRERKYIYWCNSFESINNGKLSHSQSWKNKKDKKYEYYG